MSDSTWDIWLKSEEFLPFAPAHVGTLSKHHCKAGANNDRLYITRADDGFTVLAYCWHCGKKGKHNEKAHLTVAQMKEFKQVERNKTTNKYQLPTDILDLSSMDVPVAVAIWIDKGWVTLKEARECGMVYSPSLRRVIIPTYTFGKLSQMQTRKLGDGDQGPKYCNYTNFHGLPFRAYSATDRINRVSSTKLIVIVEDALSAIRVGRHLPCMALLGTHLSDIMLAYLVEKGFDNFLVFLDDDNPAVKFRQQDLYKRLSVFGQVLVSHTEGIDPKEMSPEALKAYLAGFLDSA